MSELSSAPLVLILEDEALIAFDLQAELEAGGYGVAGPFTSCADALSWLGTGIPDMAVLDTELKDGTCRDVALALADRGVPFLIYSGHPNDDQLLSEYLQVTWIEKPAPASVLIEKCRELLAPAASG